MICGSLDGRGMWGRMDARIHMAESLCCPLETITTLLIGYVSESRSVVSDSLQPHGYSPWDSLSQNLEWQPFPSPGDLPNPGTEPRSSTLQVDSLPTEPPGKLKNSGVGSLSLLQRIVPTQESNQGLLHCRQILYQLSYIGSPKIWNTSRMCMSSLCRGHANLLCIVPILVYVLLKLAQK